ncbi:MAG: hypothetical protein WBE76_21795 [Terracidiphilus sp.]
MRYILLFALVSIASVYFSGCYEKQQSPEPTECGIYSFQTSDSSIHHGVDILVLNDDSTYAHFYTKGSSGKDLVQKGSWKRGVGNSLVFSGFVGWDLFGPTPDGVMYPDPTTTALSYSQGLDGSYEIDANSDRGEKFVQIERCPVH